MGSNIGDFWERHSRNLIAVLLLAAVCLAVDWLSGVLELVSLYPSMLGAGHLVTLAAALLALCPWERGSVRKWVGLIAGIFALAGFLALDHVFQSSSYEWLHRRAWEGLLPLLHGLGFGAPAWTFKAITMSKVSAEGLELYGRQVLPPAEGLRVVRKAEESQFSVVFLHGVHGDHFQTWCKDTDRANYWPAWVAEDFPQASVYSAQYNAFLTRWKGSTMPLTDRATSVLNMCENEGLFQKPLVFVAHSYGGLVVKQLCRAASDRDRRDILNSLKAVIFVATPHAGSGLHNFIRFALVRGLGRPTVTAEELEHAAAPLRELNKWYQRHAVPRNFVYFETQETRLATGLSLLVVDASSADPNIPGVDPVPIFADHISICKPQERGASAGIDASVKRNLADVFGTMPVASR